MSLEGRAEGDLLVGKFRVLRELGRGAMGIVYEVRHELTKHRRALKTLDPETMNTPDALDRFMREASAAGRIGNEHIVETFDAGMLETGEPYLVMELLSGVTLADHMERGGRMSLEEIGELFDQACRGIQAAHDAGIVHRDLKPENLFITYAHNRPFLKILDFGISKFTTVLGNSTRTGTTIGTPGYMSPEQVRGSQSLDGRSDIYSLGVILYECVTGEHPYPADAPTAMIANVLEVEPHPVSHRRSDAPASLDTLVARALRKNRDERFATAAELGAAIRASLDVRAPEPDEEAAALSALPHMRTVEVSTTQGTSTTTKSKSGRVVIAAVVTFFVFAGIVLAASGMLGGEDDAAGANRDEPSVPPTTVVVVSPHPTAADPPATASIDAPNPAASGAPSAPVVAPAGSNRLPDPSAKPPPLSTNPPPPGDDLATEFKP